MKQSFTYSGTKKTRDAAEKRAKKEGMRFSDLVERLLSAYNSADVHYTFDKPKRQFTNGLSFNTNPNK